MQRREFLQRSAAGGAAMLTGAGVVAGAATVRAQPAGGQQPESGGAFKLDYAPHFGMFRHHAGDDPVDQLKFMADEGFRSIEDNGMAGRPVEEQTRIARELERLGMRMGVFVCNMSTAFGRPTFVLGREDHREEFLASCRRSVEVAKRVNAKWMTVVPGMKEDRLEPAYQTANVIDQLRRGAEIFEPHGLVMVLEPLNPWRDHPGMYLTKVAQAYEVCEAVDSPACKILDDLYHQQITEGNLIPNIDAAWRHIAYFQVGDNPGRCEPTTGEINYRNVFRHIHGKGFAGIVGMEHGNSRPGKDGERAVIEAYRTVDAF